MTGTVECRSCGKKLIKESYSHSFNARNQDTGELCKRHFYGGFVCSEACDKDATIKMERSIDAHNDPSGWYRAKAKLNDPWD